MIRNLAIKVGNVLAHSPDTVIESPCCSDRWKRQNGVTLVLVDRTNALFSFTECIEIPYEKSAVMDAFPQIADLIVSSSFSEREVDEVSLTPDASKGQKDTFHACFEELLFCMNKIFREDGDTVFSKSGNF